MASRYHFPCPLLERDGSVVAVLGEAGIGKTSLLDELARRVAGDVRVLHAGCEALFTPRPLGQLYDRSTSSNIWRGGSPEHFYR